MIGAAKLKKTISVVLLIVSVACAAVAQDVTLQRPNIIGRWQVVESWNVTLSDPLELAETDVQYGNDVTWTFKDNQELHWVDRLHMVDPARFTYLYHWSWLNDTTLCIPLGGKDIYLICHLLDYSPSRLVLITNVVEKDHRPDSLCVLRVLIKIKS